MACDCDHSKTRKFTRIGGTPPRPIVVAKVTVKSECAPPPAPEEGHFLDPAYHTKFALETPASLETRWEITKSLVRVDPDPGPAPPAQPAAPCMNLITVSLAAGSTAGLQVVELTAGTDTFALTVGVGNSETIAEICDPPDCETKTASVKIVDANNNHVATLGGFPVCKCKQ